MNQKTPYFMPHSVLFICGMNAVRSPIAEALAHKFFPNIYVASAGVVPGETDPFAVAVLQEEAVSIRHHHPRGLEELNDSFFDLIIALSPKAHTAVLEKTRTFSTRVEYWPIADPTIAIGSRTQILHAYRQVREDLKQRILARFTP
ncbi:low molecular weight phosphatase family protein [Bartonella sp. DGB2]|uniref:arsenate-mycothiol transferase ArsC n=1 Tax=Bartonella sp. DGB2 TaxID=3388426 RepID=UPI0039901118